MPWEIEVNFTGKGLSGVRQGQPPRGLFRLKVGESAAEHPKDKKSGALDMGKDMIHLPITITKAFATKAVPAQDAAVNMAASIYLTLPKGYDAVQAERNEKGLKRALVVISGIAKDKAEALAKSLKLKSALFDGKEFTAWHEPSAEEGGLGNWTLLTEEEAQKVAAGSMTIAGPPPKKGAGGASEGARGAQGGSVGGAGGTRSDVANMDLDEAPDLSGGGSAPPPADDDLLS